MASLKMFGAAAVSALALLCPAAGWSQAAAQPDPARLRLAHELIEAMGGPAQMTAIFENSATGAFDATIQAGGAVTPQDRAIVQETLHEVAQDIVPAMIDDSARLYAEEFDAAQLTAIVVFYKSPAGQAMAVKLPDLSRRLGAMTMQYIPTIRARLLERLCAKTRCNSSSPGKPS